MHAAHLTSSKVIYPSILPTCPSRFKSYLSPLFKLSSFLPNVGTLLQYIIWETRKCRQLYLPSERLLNVRSASGSVLRWLSLLDWISDGCNWSQEIFGTRCDHTFGAWHSHRCAIFCGIHTHISAKPGFKASVVLGLPLVSTRSLKFVVVGPTAIRFSGCMHRASI